MKTELQPVTLMNYDFKNSHYNMTSKNLAKANWSTTTAGVFRAATSSWKPATRDGNALVLGSGCQFYFKTNYRLPLYESAYATYVPMAEHGLGMRAFPFLSEVGFL